MRPVKRPMYEGPEVSRYSAYLEPLLAAFDHYCSYCEIQDKLDVEHVAPKSKNPNLILNWDNLLLGCPRCNRDFKKSWNQSRDSYLWPDMDDTFSAFIYKDDGRVEVATDLNEETASKARELMKLVCLDDADQPQAARNRARRNTFKVARLARNGYREGYQTLDEILDQAQLGYWSVWMTVFRNHPEVRDLLLEHTSFHGTAKDRISQETAEKLSIDY